MDKTFVGPFASAAGQGLSLPDAQAAVNDEKLPRIPSVHRCMCNTKRVRLEWHHRARAHQQCMSRSKWFLGPNSICIDRKHGYVWDMGSLLRLKHCSC